ncbi:hypothetical protein [Piscirickettsia salmonis]|nr:hypothetical protein [Piscirickettsia salmonis]QGP50847.1 hypothetical protein PsalN5692_02320 [Piscirickettsia salmonis]QHS26333.1 hypothetical protein GW538_10940 [Piscirickettsia salmonis]QHS29539.1 hypothetical protein GW537_11085 [Piscirickettsia salmonis]QHS31720.1 hypothetical protein GW535_03490 [Piscirickettsia salmonis]QIX55100.1 hypothetical protein GW536_06030 [Piscirickettsia salmonis]
MKEGMRIILFVAITIALIIAGLSADKKPTGPDLSKDVQKQQKLIQP